ncbi:hypothetical protein [Halobacillus yeomjeoni]|uniref:Uncharacterized protein n=1 Tax=Halobacillus yeomjeoni TaxID=311194 RepID=A0A931HSN2_9BACI|nr:hypothetical protein [Halobacillus yeomjeoni]MBH0228648.1 hypothetical protein [Halobacillus yeomjeoni]
MSEKHWVYTNLGAVITFGLFLTLSFVTLESGSSHDIMILITEIIGGLVLVASIVSIMYIETDQKYVPVSIISFLSAWLVFALGFELGIRSSTPYKWIWFLSLYIIFITGFIFMRKSYTKITGAFKVLPVFLMFINGTFLAFILFIHLWWSLPFAGN